MPIMCRSVDLPAPDGPIIETNSPSFTSTLIRRSTYVRLVPCAYDFSILRIAMSAVDASASDGASNCGVGCVEREKNAMYFRPFRWLECLPLTGMTDLLVSRHYIS